MYVKYLLIAITPRFTLTKSAGALENAEYLFIAITPRSTLILSGSTW